MASRPQLLMTSRRASGSACPAPGPAHRLGSCMHHALNQVVAWQQACNDLETMVSRGLQRCSLRPRAEYRRRCSAFVQKGGRETAT